MNVVKITKSIFNAINVDIIKYPNSDLRRRLKLMKNFGINKILDVGANTGQYAKFIRNLGFKGEIISFEPLTKAYKKLELNVLKDRKWRSYNFALGNKDENITINVSKNLYSSSILKIMPIHIAGAPESAYIDQEIIIVKKLDDIYDDLVEKDDSVLLKIDVQGFEKYVLQGALNILSKVKGIQLEMSIIELYQGEMLYTEMISFLENQGFNLYSLENGFFNNDTGRLLQVDGIFFRD